MYKKIATMAKAQSAGLLMFWYFGKQVKVFLVRPGGPYWKNKYRWGIPKGHIEPGESAFEAGKREFKEETGIEPIEPFFSLGQTSSRAKTVQTWAFEKFFDGVITSNNFDLEWPPGTGQIISIPENDEGKWFTLKDAKRHIFESQVAIIENFEDFLKDDKRVSQT